LPLPQRFHILPAVDLDHLVTTFKYLLAHHFGIFRDLYIYVISELSSIYSPADALALALDTLCLSPANALALALDTLCLSPANALALAPAALGTLGAGYLHISTTSCATSCATFGATCVLCDTLTLGKLYYNYHQRLFQTSINCE